MKLKAIILKVCIIFLIVWGLGFTIGQKIPIEFSSHNFQNSFYDIEFIGIPISISLGLLTRIRRSDEDKLKIIKIIGSILFGGVIFLALTNIIFILGFGVWQDMNIIYTNKENNKERIIEQIYDVGAFGYGDRRIVKVKPLTFLFKTVIPIDTNLIDKNKWEFVNESVMFNQ